LNPSRDTGGNGRLLFGTAGVPHSSSGSDAKSGVETVAALGLDAMEVEFVHGVRMRQEQAEKVGERAQELKVALTCHGPYYINLNALEKEKKEASVERILATARAARWLRARSITFHAAFYLQQEKKSVHNVVREELRRIVEILRSDGNDVQIRPELTGKPSQYGDLEELLLLAEEIPGVFPCVDFSHLHARTGGKENSAEEFHATLARYQQVLGKNALLDLHLHLSGIAYSGKGEQRHLNLGDSDMRYGELLGAFREFSVGGIVVCESPNLEQDALLLKKAFQKLRP
jgi:deoxyribonuclease IV